MSEQSHASLTNSSLYMSATAQGKDLGPYIYAMKKAGGNVFSDRNVEVRVEGASPGGTTSVNIPSWGVLRDATLKVKCKFTNNATNATTPNIARNLHGIVLKKCVLKNSSKEIETLHGHSILFKTQNHPDRRRLELAGQSNLILSKTSAQTGKIVATANTDNEFEVYIPLLFSTFEHPYGCQDSRTNGVDFRFVEQCSFEFQFAQDWEIAHGGTASGSTNQTLKTPVTFTDCKLYLDYDILADEDMKTVQSQNYSMSEAQSLLNGNEIQTIATVASSGSDLDATMTLYNTQLANAMVIMVYKERNKADAEALCDVINTGASLGITPSGTYDADEVLQLIQRPWQAHQHVEEATTCTARHGADFVEIDYLEISTSGRTIFKAESLGELMYLSGRKNRGPNSSSKWCGEGTEIQGRKGLSDNNIYVIPFTNFSFQDQLSGGSLSLKSLNSIQVRVKCNECKSNANYNVEVLTLYNQITQVSASSGRIVKSISS
tara:strand:+ start:147 stop:1619 length:1473 start_codon:yes stop_codon:yes gene_type:complete